MCLVTAAVARGLLNARVSRTQLNIATRLPSPPSQTTKVASHLFGLHHVGCFRHLANLFIVNEGAFLCLKYCHLEELHVRPLFTCFLDVNVACPSCPGQSVDWRPEVATETEEKDTGRGAHAQSFGISFLMD